MPDPPWNGILEAAVARGWVWIARAGEERAGFVVMTDRFFSRPFVSLLQVGEAWRRRGVGSALMAAAEAACPGERLFTSTNESNAAMRALLAGRGYEASGVVHNLDPGDPELIFVKRVR